MTKRAQKPDLAKNVMAQIKKNRLKIKPRAYFFLGSLVLAVGLASLLGLASFFAHLVFFRFRVHQPFGFLKFGLLGFRPFFHALPSTPLLIAIGGIWGGLELLKKYDISYKKNFLGISLAIVLATLFIGFGLDKIGLPKRAAQLPPLHPWFQPDPHNQDWLVGEVLAANADSLIIRTPEEKEVIVTLTEKTHFPLGTEFSVGDKLMIVGEWKNNQFTAFGVACRHRPTSPPTYKNRQNGNNQFHPKGIRLFRQMLP